MAKNKLNLKTASQTHGKLEPELDDKNQESKYEITSLDQLWHGDSIGFGKYKTDNLDEYKEFISPDNMNTAELRRHAVEVAHVVPATSRERLEKRLVLEFQKHWAGFRQAKIKPVKDKEPSKEALKIMSEVK